MPTTLEVMDEINKKGINWLILQFIDLDGQIREYNINKKAFSELHFSKGVPCPLAKEIFEYEEEINLVPKPNTFFQIPWGNATGKFITKLYDKDGGRFLKDVIYPLERVKEFVKAEGYEQVGVSASISFHLFENYSIDRNSEKKGPAVTIETREGAWNPSPFIQEPRLLSSYPNDTYTLFRQQLSNILKESRKIEILTHFHGPSTAQQVMVMDELEIEEMADAIVDFIYITKVSSMLNGFYATFMPLPIAEEEGNSLKINLRIYKDGENIFEDKNDKLGLSDEAYYFVGGIIKHINTILLFANPTTNSYKKFLKEGYYSSFGKGKSHSVSIDNGAITIPFLDVTPLAYLGLAAIIAAGLDGIKHKINPPEFLQKSPNQMTSLERKKKKVIAFPRDLYTVIEGLEKDVDFVKSFISTDLLVTYLEKRLNEFKKDSSIPTYYEFKKYF